MPESTDEISDSNFDILEIMNPPSSHLKVIPSTDIHATPSAEADLAPADASIPAFPTNQEKGMLLLQAEWQVGEWTINRELR